MIRVDLETAEMVKYADNVWHALKVCFGNEIGSFCKAVGLDGHRVMDAFCQDTKLNISRHYLTPGFAFGGSCLPKDVRAFAYKARTLDLELPVVNSILPSNSRQVDEAFRLIVAQGNYRIGVLGLSFKPGTDDLRESPVVELVERLLGKGYEILIFDANVGLADLMGANRDYIFSRIPHIAPLLAQSPQDVVKHSQTIVIGNKAPEFEEVVRQAEKGKVVVDLVRVLDRTSETGRYEGICW
jgi:GDP-mannose 6-dehydrogenase